MREREREREREKEGGGVRKKSDTLSNIRKREKENR